MIHLNLINQWYYGICACRCGAADGTEPVSRSCQMHNEIFRASSFCMSTIPTGGCGHEHSLRLYELHIPLSIEPRTALTWSDTIKCCPCQGFCSGFSTAPRTLQKHSTPTWGPSGHIYNYSMAPTLHNNMESTRKAKRKHRFACGLNWGHEFLVRISTR
jgi:hypothetical protein